MHLSFNRKAGQMFLVEWKFAGFIFFIILFIYENEPRCAYLGSFFLWVCRPFFVNFMFLMCLTAHYTYFSSLESGLNRAFWKILMQKNTNLWSSFHLKSVKSLFSFRNCIFCHCKNTSLIKNSQSVLIFWIKFSSKYLSHNIKSLLQV